MHLAQRQNAVTLVRLKTTTPQSQIKHSTTEPLHSHDEDADVMMLMM